MAAATVVVAIYSTLGLATTLADVIGARELLDNIAFLALLVIVGAVFVLGLRRFMPNVAAIAIVAATVAVYTLVFLRAASPIERSHMAEYSVLALLIYEALMERARQRPWCSMARSDRDPRRIGAWCAR